nr:hypothetical protein [Candidatus Sigynarchaeum springense]
MEKKQMAQAPTSTAAEDPAAPSKDPSHVSVSPVNPPSRRIETPKFDVNQIFDGSATLATTQGIAGKGAGIVGPDEKARKACFWIVNNAIISPF